MSTFGMQICSSSYHMQDVFSSSSHSCGMTSNNGKRLSQKSTYRHKKLLTFLLPTPNMISSWNSNPQPMPPSQVRLICKAQNLIQCLSGFYKFTAAMAAEYSPKTLIHFLKKPQEIQRSSLLVGQLSERWDV